MKDPLLSITQSLRDVAIALGVAAVGAAALLSGCSYAQMHGYSVVRTSADVSYEPGAFQLFVASEEPMQVAELEAGMREGLGARAPEFIPAADPDTAFSVRVNLEPADVEDGRTLLRARVEVLERDGSVTSELSMEHTVEAMDAPAMTRIGRAFGERIAHYMRERERYHHW